MSVALLDRPVRRPQAQRSAGTRAKLVDAAILCLHRVGYASTTVAMVAAEAGVSRGAMTHQFPAKTDLMLATVRAIFERDGEAYDRTAVGIDPVEWVRNLPTTMWSVMSQPSGIALLEILLASRSDPELADRLRDIQTRIDAQAHRWILDRLDAAGIAPRADTRAIHHLAVAAVRGLAIEALFMRDRAEIEKSIAVLTETLGALYPTQ